MKIVLIVGDYLDNPRILSKILTKRGGLAVKHTENVEEVMQIAANGEADLILMDVSLSHSVYQGKSVDGIKITQLLKADPQTASLPIILVTAHAMAGDKETFLAQSGADGYISKPVVDHQDFVNQIKAWLPDWVNITSRRKKKEQGTRKKELFVGSNKQLKLLNYKVFLNSDSSFFLSMSRAHNAMSSDF